MKQNSEKKFGWLLIEHCPRAEIFALSVQVQQKSLEQAIKQFPKGTPERWDRISGKVQGKSTEECIQRFKHLAEMVKARKVEAAS